MSSFGSADFPVQHPVAEPTSDDELQLIFEVESLQTQLSEAGRPVDEQIAHILIQSVAPNKLLPERIRRWKARRDHLQKMADRPHATSTAHPTLPPDHLQKIVDHATSTTPAVLPQIAGRRPQ